MSISNQSFLVQKCDCFVSWAFMPLLIPIYSLIGFFFINFFWAQYLSSLIIIFLFAFFFSVFLPVALIYMLYSLGKIDSPKLETPADRLWPCIGWSVSLLICGSLMAARTYFFVPAIFASFAGASLLIGLCSLKDWICPYSATMAAWLCPILVLTCSYPMITYIPYPLVMVSVLAFLTALVPVVRMLADKTTLQKVLVGYVVGGIPSAAVMIYFLTV